MIYPSFYSAANTVRTEWEETDKAYRSAEEEVRSVDCLFVLLWDDDDDDG